MVNTAVIQNRLGYTFRDPELLRLALTHPSVAHEQGAAIQHNQRLEFLGDAVLQLVLTRELYEKFPGVGEGPLTKARAQMVNRRTLAEQGRRLMLGEDLVLSRGEELNRGRERPSALADAFEALLGAIFLDGGFEAAQDFILSIPGHPEVFAVGDIALVLGKDGQPVPGVSPAAMQMAKYVAKAIAEELSPRRERRQARPPFEYWDRGSMATIGRSAAVAKIGALEFSGYPAWLAWLLVHLVFLMGFRNKIAVFFNWVYSYFTYKRGMRIVTGLSDDPEYASKGAAHPEVARAESIARA